MGSQFLTKVFEAHPVEIKNKIKITAFIKKSPAWYEIIFSAGDGQLDNSQLLYIWLSRHWSTPRDIPRRMKRPLEY